MAKKNGPELVYGFVLGFLAALAAVFVWNSLVIANNPGYSMMPYMMHGMMGYGTMGYGMMGYAKADCSKLTQTELIDAGDTFMENMMGKDFDERMDNSMSQQTRDMMHLAMGRMYNNC